VCTICVSAWSVRWMVRFCTSTNIQRLSTDVTGAHITSMSIHYWKKDVLYELHSLKNYVLSSTLSNHLLRPFDGGLKIQNTFVWLLVETCWRLVVRTGRFESTTRPLATISLSKSSQVRVSGLPLSKRCVFDSLHFIVNIKLHFIMSKWSGPRKILRHRNGTT